MSDEPRESYNAYIGRRMREDAENKPNHFSSDIDALKKDMKELTEAYYTAIKRIKTLNDEIRHLKVYLTTTHEMRKLITPETSEEKLRHYINVSADLRKDIDKDEQKYDGEAPSTIASFYKK
jgi:predicted  nucleic acid-binding Zn-ribbon protein|tara:strand:- start:351 stop:716 length:366 start_codon:yes stop_codon:yes gene_type:complete